MRVQASNLLVMKSYGSFCPVAKAAEVLTERWTLLVLRDLLLGSRRFNDLRRGVPKMSLDLPRFRGEAWRWVSVADWRSWRRPPCGCSSLVRPQRSPFLHPGPCAGSAVAHSPCQARAFCAPARACA